jgi:zinc protease
LTPPDPTLRPPALPGEIERARLANGLEVCLLRNPQAPIVATSLVYRVGARDESAGRSGLAHFLEHMMFKGSERYGPGEVDRRTQALGGANNAFTSHDLTAYWFTFAADRWREALAIEADRMRGLRLAPAEVEAERSVILEEIAMYRDDPWEALDEQVQARLYGDHPYGRPVIGREEDLARADRAALAALHAACYRPANAVLVLAGDVDGGALAAAAEAFGTVAGEAPPARPAFPPPATPTELVRVERRQGELTRLLLALPAPPVDAPGHAELRLLATLLAEGRASRLQRALVEEGQLCLGVSVTVGENVLASHVAIATDLLPGSDAGEVERHLFAELARLRNGGIEDDELERARRVFLADWVLGVERIHQQGVTAALALAQVDLGLPERLLARALASPKNELGAAARRWLDPEAGSVLGICRPESGSGA